MNREREGGGNCNHLPMELEKSGIGKFFINTRRPKLSEKTGPPLSSIAQWVSRFLHVPMVDGSNPAGGNTFLHIQKMHFFKNKFFSPNIRVWNIFSSIRVGFLGLNMSKNLSGSVPLPINYWFLYNPVLHIKIVLVIKFVFSYHFRRGFFSVVWNQCWTFDWCYF